MPPKTRFVQGLVVVLCLLFCVRSVRQAAAVSPLYNWDMIPYIALAIAWEEDEPEVIHRRAYEAIADELPAEEFAKLVGGGVRRVRAEDPAAFYEHLAFYRARVLYNLPVYLLNKVFGVPFTNATWWMSRGAWFALAVLMAAWSMRALGWLWGIPIGTLLAHAPWLVAHMHYSSPDMQATLMTCLGLFLMIELRRDIAGAALLTAAIGVRPDTVILAVFLAGALWFFDREGRPAPRFLGIWLVATFVAYFAVQAHAGAYGWWPLFWISFVKKEAFPAQIPTSPDWGIYWTVLRAKVAAIPNPAYHVQGAGNRWGVTGSTLPLAMIGTILAAFELARRARRREFARYQALFVALLATYAVRWLLFPQLWDRFFAVMYVCVPLVLLSMIVKLIEGGTRSTAVAGPGPPTGMRA